MLRVSYFGAAVASLAAIVLALAIWPSTSSAYRELRGDKGQKDPCTTAGVGLEGGSALRTYQNPEDPDQRVTVTLMCTPRKAFPSFTFAKMVSTWMGGYAVFSGGGGGLYEPGVIPSYLHGDIADNLRLGHFKAGKAIVDALVAAGVSGGTSLAISLIVCAAGGIETLGLSCAAGAAIVGGAVVKAIIGGVAAVVKDFIAAQWNLYRATANAKWFVWMEDWGLFWNSVARVSDIDIDPSLSNSRIGSKMKIRVGVQFTSAPAGGGPDFFDIKQNGELTERAKAEAKETSEPVDPAHILRGIRSMNFNHGVLGIHQDGRHRVRTGSRGKNDVLRGGTGDDTLQGIGGNNRLIAGAGHDTAIGGRGNDRIGGGPGDDHLNGRAGNDRIWGGGGTNTLIAGGGRNVLVGGPGSDTIAAWGRRTIARTGRNRRGERDYINVRNRRRRDLVICDSRRSLVIADRTDRIRGRCGRVIRRGPFFAPNSTAASSAPARAR